APGGGCARDGAAGAAAGGPPRPEQRAPAARPFAGEAPGPEGAAGPAGAAPRDVATDHRRGDTDIPQRLDGAALTVAADPAAGAEASVATGPADSQVVGKDPGDRAGAAAAGQRAADAAAPAPAGADLRAGAGAAPDRPVPVEGGAGHRVVAARDVQAAAGGD